MTDTPAPPPASVLAAAREAVELAAKEVPGHYTYDNDLAEGRFIAHACNNIAAISAALLAAHEREAGLRAEVGHLRAYRDELDAWVGSFPLDGRVTAASFGRELTVTSDADPGRQGARQDGA